MESEENTRKITLSRRKFLTIAGAASLATIPAATGYYLLSNIDGELPEFRSPYVTHEFSNKASLLEQPMPILVLLDDRSPNPFGAYLGEILRTEGIFTYRIADISIIDEEVLSQTDTVILSSMELTNPRIEMLDRFVNTGGGLIAMQPDPRLQHVLGVRSIGPTIKEGYLRTDAQDPASRGIVNEAMQFHGEADVYTLAGARAIAWIGQSAKVGNENPALTFFEYGLGQAAMWTYDLAKSIALMRQGNPTLANTPSDGWDGVRTINLFVNWFDLEMLETPQADEQQRLLVNLISMMSQSKRPLARLWYFPDSVDGVVIATGDSHINPDWAIEDVLNRVERFDGRMSIYYLPSLESSLRRFPRRIRSWMTDELPIIGEFMADWFDTPTPRMVRQWRDRGHEFTLHPAVENGLVNSWRKYSREFIARGFGPISETVRTHRILWTGWVETARLQASYGIRMNMDYYHWGPLFQNPDGEWIFGHFTGSSLPMRFVDENGKILDIYQQLTHLADDHMLDLHWGGVAKLKPQAAVRKADRLFTLAKTRFPGAIVTHFHVDPYAVGGESATRAGLFLEGTLERASELGFPIWSTRDWNIFNRIRGEITLDDMNWDPDSMILNFLVQIPFGAPEEFSLMFPLRQQTAELSEVRLDGIQVTHGKRTVGGVDYACARTPPGSHVCRVVYA